MLSVRNLLRGPRAVGYWLGLGDSRALEGDDLVFLCHGTPRASAASLERQLRYLRRVFTLVPLGTIADSLGEARVPGRRRAAIVFDDGLRSNVLVAYPVLRALGIPATFFVCPGLIEERRWLWTHETRRRLHFAGPALRAELARELGAPTDADAFVEWMKKLDFGRRTQVEARLREATARFVPSALERETFDLATWEEWRALDPSIATVGSHSMTHPILPSLDAARIEVEVGESRRVIEAKLGRPAELFSYPNGDADETTLGAVRRHYRAAVRHGSTARADPHLMLSEHLPRSVLALAWKVNAPTARPVEALVCAGKAGINSASSRRAPRAAS